MFTKHNEKNHADSAPTKQMPVEFIQLAKELNTEGFIPGPHEAENLFYARVVFCRNLKDCFEELTGFKSPEIDSISLSNTYLNEALPDTEELYGIKPSWVPLIFSNKKLSPWHGGCAWIFQSNKNGSTAAFLQLRLYFQNAPLFLKIYSRKELITHELAHTGRMMYQEPLYEEIHAYQSSPSSLRKWLGPIFSSQKESTIFISLLFLIVTADFLTLFLDNSFGEIAEWLRVVPIAYFSWLLAALYQRHQTYKKCLSNLKELYPEREAKHLLYRLSDSEIITFSHLTPSGIREFIKQASLTSFRWRFLQEVY